MAIFFCKLLDSIKTSWKSLSALSVMVIVVIIFWRTADVQTARYVIRFHGYAFTASCFLVVVSTLFLLVKGKVKEGCSVGRPFWKGLITVGLFSILSQVNEPHRYKVLGDEHAIFAQSQMMHLYREACIPSNAHFINAQLNHTVRYVGKRGTFFQFLLSCVHDISGYRVTNVFFLNSVVTFAFYGLVFIVSYRLFSKTWVAIGTCAIIFSIPLVAQMATSAGYDLLNVTLLLAIFATSIRYFTRPDTHWQALMIYLTLLASMTRAESILFLIPVSALIVTSWAIQGRVLLDWRSIISPLFLLLPLLINVHVAASPLLLDAEVRKMKGDVPFMSLDYIPNNLAHAVKYFFQFNRLETNSVLASWCGVIGFVLLATIVFLRRSRNDPKVIILFLFSVTSVTTFLIIMANHWGQITDHQASRFSISIYVFSVLAFSLVLNQLREKSLRFFVYGIFGYAIMFTIPSSARHFVTHSMVASSHSEFFLEFAERNRSPSNLFISGSVLELITNSHACLSMSDVNNAPESVMVMKGFGAYERFYALEMLEFDAELGDFTNGGARGRKLGPNFIVEVIDEVRFLPTHISRIVEIVGYKKDGEIISLEALEYPLNEFKSQDEYFRFMYEVYPLRGANYGAE